MSTRRPRSSTAVSRHSYCWHLGCILPKIPAISLLTGKEISDSFATQINAEKLKTKQWQDVLAMCEEMRKYDGFGDGNSKHFSEGDCEELKDAAQSMFESRRVVKFTYVRSLLELLISTWLCYLACRGRGPSS